MTSASLPCWTRVEWNESKCFKKDSSVKELEERFLNPVGLNPNTPGMVSCSNMAATEDQENKDNEKDEHQFNKRQRDRIVNIYRRKNNTALRKNKQIFL